MKKRNTRGRKLTQEKVDAINRRVAIGQGFERSFETPHRRLERDWRKRGTWEVK